MWSWRPNKPHVPVTDTDVVPSIGFADAEAHRIGRELHLHVLRESQTRHVPLADAECCATRLLQLLDDMVAGRGFDVDVVAALRDELAHTDDVWDVRTIPRPARFAPDVRRSLDAMLCRPSTRNAPVDFDGTRTPTVREAPRHATAAEIVLDTAELWGWDAFALRGATHGRELSVLGMRLFEDSGLIAHFDMDVVRLQRFLRKIECEYHDNPYHSCTHAADVLQSMHKIMLDGGVFPGYADHVGLLSAYLAAIVHDVGHSGLTNQYLIDTRHSLAVLYNDQSPHENHHMFLSWTWLTDPKQDFLASVAPDVKRRVRATVIDLVLATDPKKTMAQLARFQSRMLPLEPGAPPGASADHDERRLVLQMAMKVADIGHLGGARDVHLEWVRRLEDEFVLQGIAERAHGLPVSAIVSGGIANSQAGFFEVVALPLVRSFAAVLPGCQPLRASFEENYAYWLSR